MKLGSLNKPKRSRRTSKRRGQGPGSGNGKTAGRGHKGQRSRSGARRGSRFGFEGGQMPLFRRIPKIGFSNQPFRTVYQTVNVGEIDAAGLDGEIGPAELHVAGLIRKSDKPVKVLGGGGINRSLRITAHAFSGSATTKILAAGGTAEILNT